MRFACWVIKPADTNSEYLILTALLQEQSLRERVSMLCLQHVARLVGVVAIERAIRFVYFHLFVGCSVTGVKIRDCRPAERPCLGRILNYSECVTSCLLYVE